MNKLVNDYMSSTEVADTLGVCLRTVLRWSNDGRMPAPVRMGRRFVRYRRTEIQEWIDNGFPDSK